MGRRIDAELTISAPDGTTAVVIVEVKRTIQPIDVRTIVSQLHYCLSQREAALVIAPFLGQRTRELLAGNGIGYADATGNLRLQLDQPAVYLEATGAVKNPWAEYRQLHSLKGPAAGRIVRALCDLRPPFGIRELAERTQTPVASVDRVVALLEREALLTRDAHGKVVNTMWPELIRRWTQDYNLVKSNTVHSFLDPRGLDALLQTLAETEQSYAVTGSLAAVHVAPIAPPRLGIVYVNDIESAAERLALRRAEKGINVLLAKPFDPVVFERTFEQDGVTYAALSQVTADLLTGPGRGPQEADELLKWMKEHEDAWRR